ncbi:MAG: hypothetical protein AAGJ35_11510, partial [Myxococcota bacterium]
MSLYHLSLASMISIVESILSPEHLPRWQNNTFLRGFVPLFQAWLQEVKPWIGQESVAEEELRMMRKERRRLDTLHDGLVHRIIGLLRFALRHASPTQQTLLESVEKQCFPIGLTLVRSRYDDTVDAGRRLQNVLQTQPEVRKVLEGLSYTLDGQDQGNAAQWAAALIDITGKMDLLSQKIEVK